MRSLPVRGFRYTLTYDIITPLLFKTGKLSVQTILIITIIIINYWCRTTSSISVIKTQLVFNGTAVSKENQQLIKSERRSVIIRGV